MGWKLAPRVSFCVASDKAIFLNVRTDRYVRLPAALNMPFVEWVTMEGAPEPSDALERLYRAELLVPDAATSRLLPCSAQRAVSGLSDLRPDARISLARWITFRRHLRRTRRLLARDGLAALVDHIAIRRTAGQRRPDACEAVEPFLAAGAALGSGEDCLVRSLALLDCLHRAGADATLMFGVLAEPFRAHCWVQSGEHVLNDGIDRVSLFTPILAA
jgi:hypothetical protein